MQHEKTVFRQFSLPVSVFDHLKQFQRDYQAKHGVQLTNNEVLSIIVKQHQTMTTNVEEEASSREHKHQ